MQINNIYILTVVIVLLVISLLLLVWLPKWQVKGLSLKDKERAVLKNEHAEPLHKSLVGSFFCLASISHGKISELLKKGKSLNDLPEQ
jgi:hypothetical protein